MASYATVNYSVGYCTGLLPLAPRWTGRLVQPQALQPSSWLRKRDAKKRPPRDKTPAAPRPPKVKKIKSHARGLAPRRGAAPSEVKLARRAETRAETPRSLGQAEAARRALASVAAPSDSADPGSSQAASAESIREALDDGLALLRRARDAARDAGDSPAAMVDADAELAAAVTALRRASALADSAAGESPGGESPGGESPGDSSSSPAAAAAAGNLANALLARGRLQRRLANAAAREEARARNAGIRAGVEGAADYHAELADEFLVLAGRSFRRALVECSNAPGIEPATSPGATRALTGWGAALALRGRTVFEAGDPESSTEATALAQAAAEKYRAALETPFATDPSSTFDDARRAGTLMDWGDALRLAGDATRAAEGGFVRSATGDAGGGSGGLEFFEQAARIFSEAARLDPAGCGAEANRLAAACEDAMRDGWDGGDGDDGWARARGGDPPPSPFPPYEPWR